MFSWWKISTSTIWLRLPTSPINEIKNVDFPFILQVYKHKPRCITFSLLNNNTNPDNACLLPLNCRQSPSNSYVSGYPLLKPIFNFVHYNIITQETIEFCIIHLHLYLVCISISQRVLITSLRLISFQYLMACYLTMNIDVTTIIHQSRS